MFLQLFFENDAKRLKNNAEKLKSDAGRLKNRAERLKSDAESLENYISRIFLWRSSFS